MCIHDSYKICLGRRMPECMVWCLHFCILLLGHAAWYIIAYICPLYPGHECVVDPGSGQGSSNMKHVHYYQSTRVTVCKLACKLACIRVITAIESDRLTQLLDLCTRHV